MDKSAAHIPMGNHRPMNLIECVELSSIELRIFYRVLHHSKIIGNAARLRPSPWRIDSLRDRSLRRNPSGRSTARLPRDNGRCRGSPTGIDKVRGSS